MPAMTLSRRRRAMRLAWNSWRAPIDACAFLLVARLLLARRSHPDLLVVPGHPGRAESYPVGWRQTGDPDVGGHG
jgi:hypothetical protein